MKKIQSTIPIELLSFTARVEDKQGLLKWSAVQTATAEYIIEKSDNGKDFAPIGSLKGGEADGVKPAGAGGFGS